MARVNAGGYVAIHVVLMAGWPLLLLIGDRTSVSGWTTFVLNLVLFLAVWRACSSPACGYAEGMERIAAPLMSGCANITILYLPLVLAFVHVVATFYALLGLIPSGKPASLRWERLVRDFGGRPTMSLAPSNVFDMDRPAAAPQHQVVRNTVLFPPLPGTGATPGPAPAPPPRDSGPAALPSGPAPAPAPVPEAVPPSRIPLLLDPRPRQAGKAVYFVHLPVPARDRLAAATRGPARGEDLLSIPLESSASSRFGAAVGAIALAGLFLFALSSGAWSLFGEGRREFGSWWLLAGPVFGATALLVFHGSRLRLSRRSRLLPAVVANPLLLARTGLDHEPVEVHYLCDLLAFDEEHHYANGGYSRTDVAARFGTGRVSVVLKSRLDADRLAAFLRFAPARLAAWEKAGDLDARVAREDWLGLLPGSAPAPAAGAAPRAPWSASRANLVLLSGTLAIVLTWAAWGSNLLANESGFWRTARSRDTPEAYAAYLNLAPFLRHREEATALRDEAMWRKAVEEDQPQSYGFYRDNAPLKRHAEEAEARGDDARFRNAGDSIRALRGYGAVVPALPHAAEAAPRIAELYRNALASYPPESPDVDPDAAAAVKALLARAVESGCPDVRLVFEPVEALDSETIEKVFAGLTGKTNVQPMGRSFTADKSRARESGMAAAIENAIRKVLPEGAL